MKEFNLDDYIRKVPIFRRREFFFMISQVFSLLLPLLNIVLIK